MMTTIFVILSMLLTIPIANIVLGQLCEYFIKEYPGGLPYYVKPGNCFLCGHRIFQTRKVKKIPLADAVKNVE